MKKIFVLILVLVSLCGCVKKEFDFALSDDFLYVKNHLDDVDRFIVKTETLLGEKCYLVDKEEGFKALEQTIVKEETTEYITDSNMYYYIHFDFDEVDIYAHEGVLKYFRFEGGNLIHDGKKYKLEKEHLFFTDESQISEEINKENTIILVSDNEIDCDTDLEKYIVNKKEKEKPNFAN